MRGRRFAALTMGLMLAAPMTLIGPSAGAAPGNSNVAAAIESLRSDPPLYNDHRAPLALDPAGADQVRASIAAAGTPIYLAILPTGSGKARTVCAELSAGLDKPGTYVAVVGQSYSATSNEVNVDGLMQEAFASERNAGTAAVLVEFTQLVSERARGGDGGRPGVPWTTIALVVALVAVAGVGYAVHAHRSEPPRGTDSVSDDQVGAAT